MPFRAKVFLENLGTIEGATRDELSSACKTYAEMATPQQKAHCIRRIMDVLDREVDEKTRHTIMEACGRRCIGASTLKTAQNIAESAQGPDDLLARLNAAHIGGGHLQRTGDVIHAAYDRCYCGSVSATREPFTATYCHCSCGWYERLFEAALGAPVQVGLLNSILQGDERCQFLVHVSKPGPD